MRALGVSFCPGACRVNTQTIIMSVAYITSELPEFTVDAANKMRPP
jgi:hypothetical protein